MKTPVIKNDEGDAVTRINVMHIVSYDVEQVASDLLEDMHSDDAVVSLDDVLERIQNLAQDDFGYKCDLIYQDQDGNDL